MKTSNKILLVAYGIVILALTVMIFISRPLVEKAFLGNMTINSGLVK